MADSFASNEDYKNRLINTTDNFYLRYAADAKRLAGGKGKFLDVGCGTGNVLKILSKTLDKGNLYGIDVSEFFINELKNEYRVSVYDGKKIPFEDSFFDVVGSFTVIERVPEPYAFLDEKIRVLKTGGYLITACPNFLSPMNKVRGYSIVEKLQKQIKYFFGKKLEMNDPIIREKIQSDDDAIVVTNMTPIVRFLKSKKLKITYISGIMSKQNLLVSLVADMPLIRLMLPSAYVIARKSQ